MPQIIVLFNTCTLVFCLQRRIEQVKSLCQYWRNKCVQIEIYVFYQPSMGAILGNINSRFSCTANLGKKVVHTEQIYGCKIYTFTINELFCSVSDISLFCYCVRVLAACCFFNLVFNLVFRAWYFCFHCFIFKLIFIPRSRKIPVSLQSTSGSRYEHKNEDIIQSVIQTA